MPLERVSARHGVPMNTTQTSTIPTKLVKYDGFVIPDYSGRDRWEWVCLDRRPGGQGDKAS